MPENKNNVNANNDSKEYASEEIRRLNEYIDDQYRTDMQTLPALAISEVLDPAKLETARKVYEQRVNPNPKDDDIMDESGITRKEMKDMYSKGIPPASVKGLDNDKPVKHTIDVRLEDGKPVIEVNSNREGEKPVIIAEPPSNVSPALGEPTDTSSVTAPVATSAFPTEKELESRKGIEEILARESAAADTTKMNRAEEYERNKTGNERPTVAATPVPSIPATSPSDVPADENNVENK